MTDSHKSADPGLALTIDVEGARATVVLRGELDLASAPLLADAVQQLAVDGLRMIELDLGELDFCDSTGISAMLAARTRMLDCGGALTVARAQGKPLRVLTMTGVLDLLTDRAGDESKP